MAKRQRKLPLFLTTPETKATAPYHPDSFEITPSAEDVNGPFSISIFAHAITVFARLDKPDLVVLLHDLFTEFDGVSKDHVQSNFAQYIETGEVALKVDAKTNVTTLKNMVLPLSTLLEVLSESWPKFEGFEQGVVAMDIMLGLVAAMPFLRGVYTDCAIRVAKETYSTFEKLL